MNYESFLFYDKPIPYKTLLIYPVKMNDYLNFHFYVNSLLIDKNSIPDPKVIAMSYLEFLYYMAQTTKMPYLYMFKELLKIVLHIKEDDVFWFGLKKDGKTPCFKINNIEYNANDLEAITNIIFEQNCIDRIDDTIQKEVRDAMQEAEKYKMQQNANKMGSLEDQMICVLITTSLKLEDIYDLTIRKFSNILKRVDHKLHYEIYLSAQTSGMVKFKDENALKHWMADLTVQDKYKDVKVDMEEMQHKIDAANQ